MIVLFLISGNALQLTRLKHFQYHGIPWVGFSKVPALAQPCSH